MSAPLARKPRRPAVTLLLLGPETRSLASSIGETGILSTLCLTTTEAMSALKKLPYQAVLCDLKLPGVEEFMQLVHSQFPSVAILVYAQPGNLRGAILATLLGASGYIQAPLAPENVTEVVISALERKRLESAIRIAAAR